jgi:hypothetical protein
MNTLLGIIFGLCAIASAGVIIAWTPVLLTSEDSPRLRLVALGMVTATAGVFLLCVNRVTVALLSERLDALLFLLAAVLILAGKTLWMLGAGLGHGNGRRALWFAGVLGIAWIIFAWWTFG